jgi:trimethylamine--corrinoid protein Co-methyltransferase
MAKLLLQVFTDVEIEKIHGTALKILHQVGVKVEHKGLRDKMSKFGAKVDHQNEMVYLAPKLIDEVLQLAPKTVKLHCLDGKVLEIGGDSRHYGSIVTDPFILDYHEGPRRPRLSDIIRHTRLGDALPLISFMYRMEMSCSDVPDSLANLKTLEAFVTNTTKHMLFFPSSAESAQLIIEVGEILAGNRTLAEFPLMTIGVPITSPLFLAHDCAEMLKLAVAKGCPITCIVCPQAGATSPFSIAGTLMQTHIENLFLIAAVQALQPGAPVFYRADPSNMHRVTGNDYYCPPERPLYRLGGNELGRYIGLPRDGGFGTTAVHRMDSCSWLSNEPTKFTSCIGF